MKKEFLIHYHYLASCIEGTHADVVVQVTTAKAVKAESAQEAMDYILNLKEPKCLSCGSPRIWDIHITKIENVEEVYSKPKPV